MLATRALTPLCHVPTIMGLCPIILQRVVRPTLNQSRTFASKASPTVDYSRYVLRTRHTCLGLNIVEKGTTGFIERFGKLNRSAHEGLNLTVPFIESIRRVTLREVPVPIDPQPCITKDNVQVSTAGAVYFRVIDPHKACYETYDLLGAVVTHAQSAMRAAVGLTELDTLSHDRSALNKKILESMQAAAKDWVSKANLGRT